MNTIDCAVIEEPLGITKKGAIETPKSVINEHEEIIAAYLYRSAVHGNLRAEVQHTSSPTFSSYRSAEIPLFHLLRPITSHKISEVPDLISVPLLHQKELAIAPECLFNGTFRDQCVEMRSMLFWTKDAPQSLRFFLT